MGGIISAPSPRSQHGQSLDSFCSLQLLEGQELMKADDDLIRSFIGFLKGGTWVGRFAVYSAPTCPKDEKVSLGVDEWRIFYGLFEDNYPAYLSELNLELSRAQLTSAQTIQQGSDFDDLYEAASRCDCFDRTQLACVLFSLTFPIFMATRHKNIPQSFSRFWHRSETADSCPSGSPSPGLIQSTESQRAQGLLLGFAAYFDADCLEGVARQGWLDVVSRAVMEHRLAISIVDTSKPFAPFEYVNAAFSSLFGYAHDALLGASMSVLRGKGTEDRQCQLLQKALHGQVPTKLWITHYTRSGQRVLDLVAVAPRGFLTVCVHFGARRGADFHKLQQVDDLLLLLGCLVCPQGRASVHHTLASLRAVLKVHLTVQEATSNGSGSTAPCASLIEDENAPPCSAGTTCLTSAPIAGAATCSASVGAYCNKSKISPCSSESGSSRAGGSVRGSGKGVGSVKVNGRLVRFQPSTHSHSASGEESKGEHVVESLLTAVGEGTEDATEVD